MDCPSCGAPPNRPDQRFCAKCGTNLAPVEPPAAYGQGTRITGPLFADDVPAIDANGTTWVEPRLVIEVRTLELTGQHRLRQPAYLGVRSDLSPADLEEVDDA